MKPPPIAIRAARPADQETIVAFNLALAAETESRALDPAVVARGVAAALADPDRLRYWVAEIAGRPAGQAAISREWSDWRAGWAWWLQSIYVRPDARRLGVFKMLHERIRSEARAAPDVVGLRLYVEAENARAQATYRALGMMPGGYHVFEELWPERFGGPDPHPAILEGL